MVDQSTWAQLGFAPHLNSSQSIFMFEHAYEDPLALLLLF